jgi:hypothetical protein
LERRIDVCRKRRELLIRFLIAPANVSRLAIGTIRLSPSSVLRILQNAPLVFDTLSHPRGRLLGVTQVVGHLQVHPKFRRRFEKCSQPDRRIPCEALVLEAAIASGLALIHFVRIRFDDSTGAY